MGSDMSPSFFIICQGDCFVVFLVLDTIFHNIQDYGRSCLFVSVCANPPLLEIQLLSLKLRRIGPLNIDFNLWLIAISQTGVLVTQLSHSVGFESVCSRIVLFNIIRELRIKIGNIRIIKLRITYLFFFHIFDQTIHQVRDQIVCFLIRIDDEGIAVGDAVKQRPHGRQVPVNRTILQLCRRRSKAVKIVLTLPFVFELTTRNGTIYLNAVVSAIAICPSDGFLILAKRVYDLIPIFVESCEFVIDNRNGEPILIGSLIHSEERRNTTAACFHRVGGTVADLNRADSHSLDDFAEYLRNGSVQLCGFACIEVILGLLSRGYDIIDASIAMLAVHRIIHKVVQQVGLGTVGIDAIEGAISCSASVGNIPCIIGCVIVEGS